MSTLVMRFCLCFLLAVALLDGFAFGQNVSGTAKLAAAVSEPVRLTPDARGAVPPEQIRQLLQRAEEKDLENDKRQRDYTYIEHVERLKLDSNGKVKKTETSTSEVLEIYGEPVVRTTGRDDKPLSAD